MECGSAKFVLVKFDQKMHCTTHRIEGIFVGVNNICLSISPEGISVLLIFAFAITVCMYMYGHMICVHYRLHCYYITIPQSIQNIPLYGTLNLTHK